MNIQVMERAMHDELSTPLRALLCTVLAGQMVYYGSALSRCKVTVAVALRVRSGHAFSGRLTYSR